MRITWSILLLFFLFTALLDSRLAYGLERLAVMNLKAKYGIEKSLADALSEQVRIGIHKLGRFEVLSKEDLDVLAERAAMIQKIDCTADSQCLINFGRSIGTRFMVAGSISKIGDIYTISLRLLDTEGKLAGVKQRVGRKCHCTEEELMDVIQEAAQAVMQSKDLLPSDMGVSSGSVIADRSAQPLSQPANAAERESWYSRYKWWIAAGVVVIGGVAAAGAGGGGGGGETTNTPAQGSEGDSGPINLAW